MKTLNLKLQGGLELKPIIEIDGKVVPYKRNKYKNIILSYETDKEEIDLRIKNILEINGPYWWLIQMFFFIITIFGILNPKLEKLCYSINYHSKIKLDKEKTAIAIKFNPLKDKNRAIETIDEGEITEIENEYLLDLKAKKRKKILKILYLLSWIVLIAVVTTIIII